MKLRIKHMSRPTSVFGFFAFAAMVMAFAVAAPYYADDAVAQEDSKRLVSVYDRGLISTFLTDQQTIAPHCVKTVLNLTYATR